MIVEVYDNGVGAAVPRPGGGLAGLADRAATIDGTLSVDSPLGRSHDDPGGTALRMVRAEPMRVVIAEDSVLLREGLARLLADGGIETVGVAGDGPRAGGRGGPA